LDLVTKPVPASLRSPKPALIAGLSVLLVLSLLFQFVSWDLDLAAWFWSWSTGPWPGRAWTWSHTLYVYGELPAYICGVLGALTFVLSYRIDRLRRWRGLGLFAFLLLLLGPGLLVNVIGKPLTGRPRPSDLELFGGAWDFVKPWHFGTPGRGTSFPGGHASMAFYWLGLYFIPRRRGLRLLGLTFGLAFGAAMSAARMSQGGHFLSDNLISGALLFILAATLSPLLSWQPTPRFWARPKVVAALGAAAFGCLFLGRVTYEERAMLWAMAAEFEGQDLDEVLDELIATCNCPACHRYRCAFASRLVYYAAKMEQTLGKDVKR
jgi:membrane-associated PAP2 superfamily phosphatase